MKLSTRTEYGLRAILELAKTQGKGPLQLKVIAKNQDISIKYLEQLMAILRSASFIRSVRGSKGGYILAKPPNEIKIGDVFRALEGNTATVECIENENFCDKMDGCVIRQLWIDVQKAIDSVLLSTTLQDLVDRTMQKDTLSYQI